MLSTASISGVRALRGALPDGRSALRAAGAADLVREAAARVRRDLDLESARRLQRRMMSGTLPEDAGVRAVVEYRPALGVGGDFYDLRYLGSGRVSIAIGDVAGCGVSAALVMSRVASDLDRAFGAGDAPAAALARVSGCLAGSGAELFVTASCLRLDTGTRTLTVANAGHLPVAVRRASGEVFTCGGASGTPLGIERCVYVDEDVALARGDLLLLATDGLLEALEHPGGGPGQESLLALMRAAPHDAGALHERLCAAVDEAARERDLDDVTWVGLQLAA